MEIASANGQGGTVRPIPSPRSPLTAAKLILRRTALVRRQALCRAAGPAAGLRLCRSFRRAFRPRRGLVVAGYWPMRDEIDVRPLLARLAGQGCVIALPEMVGRERPLAFRLWRPGTALEPGPHGTRHPGRAAPLVEPRLVLVPLVAFDRAGWRLGYGGGFYDRTLARLRARRPVTAVGIGFAGQEIFAVPHDGRDQPLDAVVTERGPVRLRRGGRP